MKNLRSLNAMTQAHYVLAKEILIKRIKGDGRTKAPSIDLSKGENFQRSQDNASFVAKRDTLQNNASQKKKTPAKLLQMIEDPAFHDDY